MRASLLEESQSSESANTFQKRVVLERELGSLTQRLESVEADNATAMERERMQTTAELYRLAGLLYLQRVCPTLGDELRRSHYMENAFAALGSLQVATSPWPIFVIACESEEEEERIRIIQVLDQMDTVRSIGNVYVMRYIIEMVWKQHDLRGDAKKGGQIKWWHFVDSDVAAPWFA